MNVWAHLQATCTTLATVYCTGLAIGLASMHTVGQVGMHLSRGVQVIHFIKVGGRCKILIVHYGYIRQIRHYNMICIQLLCTHIHTWHTSYNIIHTWHDMWPQLCIHSWSMTWKCHVLYYPVNTNVYHIKLYNKLTGIILDLVLCYHHAGSALEAGSEVAMFALSKLHFFSF